MKIVQIKMLRSFRDDCGCTILWEGKTYFAIDGGDYWLVQRYPDTGFIRVVPKGPKRITPTPYAEVVPIHTDEEPPECLDQGSQCPGCYFCKPDETPSTPGCCPDCGCDYNSNCGCTCC